MTNLIATPCRATFNSSGPKVAHYIVFADDDSLIATLPKDKADYLCLALNNFDDCVEALRDFVDVPDDIIYYRERVARAIKVLDRIEKGGPQ